MTVLGMFQMDGRDIAMLLGFVNVICFASLSFNYRCRLVLCGTFQMSLMEQTVIVAIDHSIQAESAIRYYVEKMHRPGNKLILVHGIELPELSIHNARECHVSPAVLANMWRVEEDKCKALESKMRGIIKEHGVSARLHSHVGRPGEVVCRLALEENASYIIIGAHGVGALKRAVLGNVSDHILQNANCPVIICRDPNKIERQRRRHMSADTGESAVSRIERERRSGSNERHKSGESLTRFASSLRRRFASGTGSHMAASVDDPRGSVLDFETTTILYPDPSKTSSESTLVGSDNPPKLEEDD